VAPQRREVVAAAGADLEMDTGGGGVDVPAKGAGGAAVVGVHLPAGANGGLQVVGEPGLGVLAAPGLGEQGGQQVTAIAGLEQVRDDGVSEGGRFHR
jgi:hypothetical protein